MGLLIIPGIFVFFIIFCFFIIDQNQKKMGRWRVLAARHKLTFEPGNLFSPTCVSGYYHGHWVELDSYSTRNHGYLTRLVLSTKRLQNNRTSPAQAQLPDKDFSWADLVERLRQLRVDSQLKGEVRTNIWQLTYVQSGIETDIKHLEAVLEVLCQLADIYPAAVALGGEAVPALHSIATNPGKLRDVAKQWLYDISNTTRRRLKAQAAKLLCPDCLARFAAHKIHLSWLSSVTYYGCRVCGQSRNVLNVRSIAVLDRHMETAQIQKGESLYINWFSRPTLFDFDTVAIVRASDEDVERFALQVGNDMDELRKSRYQDMRCVISPDCELSANSWRILERMFGQVERGRKRKARSRPDFVSTELTGYGEPVLEMAINTTAN
jgi:hypothetical protein